MAPQHRMQWSALSTLALVIAAACGDDGNSGDSLTGPGLEAGLPTGADDMGTGGPGGGPGGSGGSSGSGGATGGPGGSSGGSDGDTGAQPPRTCDFAAGCYDASSGSVSGKGEHSQILAGCEGGNFKPTASIAVAGMETGGIGGVDAARAMPVLADFTGDGALDLFVSMRKVGTFILPGDGAGDFPYAQGTPISMSLPFPFPSGWGTDAGDIDGNGTMEAAMGAHGFDGQAWLNSGGATMNPTNGFQPDGRAPFHNGVVLGDIDGDGDLDAILGPDQFGTTNVSTRIFNAGSWTDGAAPAISGSAGYMEMHDMDNDGDLDLFAFTATNGLQAQVFKNNAGSWQPAGAYDSGFSGSAGSADPRQGSVGDLNCDGFVDLAVGGAIYHGNGSSFTASQVVDDTLFGHLADMNGDGHLDLVTQGVSVGLAMYYNDGTGASFTRELDGLPDETYSQHGGPLSRPYGIDIGDVDANGNLDIVRIGGFGNQWLIEVWTR